MLRLADRENWEVVELGDAELDEKSVLGESRKLLRRSKGGLTMSVNTHLVKSFIQPACRIAGVLVLAHLSAGCALTPQQVRLAPAVKQTAPAASPITHQQAIVLVTTDERLSSSIGSRGLGQGLSAEITTTDDVGQIVRDQLVRGLGAHGLEVKTPSADEELKEPRVEVRNLEYSVTPGIITGHLRAEAVLKRICSFDGEREYEHLYRGESTEEVFVVQFAEENARHLNTALGNVIVQLLGDQKLLGCLSAKDVSG